MTTLYQLLNCSVGFDRSQRQWLLLDQPLALTPSRYISLVLANTDGHDIPMLAEQLADKPTHFSKIEEGCWLNIATRHGFTEIIPKGIRFDEQGKPEAVLIELLNIPAQQIFSV